MSDVEFDGLDLGSLGGGPFGTVLADPPWRFINRTGKVAPEHKRLSRYDTLSWKEIASMPVADVMDQQSHCYLWVPNALLTEGLAVMEAWGFTYKTMLVWAKRRKDGGPDGRGVGFYFRNVTEPILFGVRGRLRTLAPGRRQVNLIETRKREHSRKPDELYPIIEACSPGPHLELFARYPQPGWMVWGNEADEEVVPRGRQYPAYGGRADEGERLFVRRRSATPVEGVIHTCAWCLFDVSEDDGQWRLAWGGSEGNDPYVCESRPGGHEPWGWASVS